jgi:DNA polymerase III delta subunit
LCFLLDFLFFFVVNQNILASLIAFNYTTLSSISLFLFNRLVKIKLIGYYLLLSMTSIYIVLSPSESERKKLIIKIVSKIFNPVIFSYVAGEDSMERVCSQLQEPDLLASATVVILDKCELLKKEESAALQEYLEKNSSPQTFFILQGAFLKHRLQNKELILFDYSAEKPWQRQSRFKEWLRAKAKEEGKVLTGDVVEMLLAEAGDDLLRLEQELFKLVVFVGERAKIELADAKQLLSSAALLTGWQIAESLVWGDGKIKESAFDLSFIGQIRYHLQLGEEITSCLERGLSPQEIFTSLAHFKPKMLEKYLPLAQQKRRGFFKKGLQALFELELNVKSSGVGAEHLFAHFQGQLKT